MNPYKINPSSLAEIQEGLQKGEFTMVDVVNRYLHAIDNTKDLNIYIEVYSEDALRQAQNIDQRLYQGENVGSLYGCVVSIKDVIVQKGRLTTAASKILEGYKSPFDATAVKRLLDEDAIVIGRTNCDEFGMGSANENSVYGPTRNGIDPTRTPGGSSGGSAVSIQTNTCLIALGSDTGGSVRQPASFCGVYGLKPGYGRISRYGLIAYASSFDQIGILGHNADDIGQALTIIAGKDPMDATSDSKPVEKYDSRVHTRNPKVAVFPEMLNHPNLAQDVKKAINDKIEAIKASGGTVIEMDFQYLDFLVPTYYVLTTAEASTNLSRFDGVRYGYRSPNSESLEEMYVNSRTEGFGAEVKRRIMLGTFVLSEGYFDAYFTKAQKVRRLIKEEMDRVLEKADFALLPTSTDIPWKLGQHSEDPLTVYLSDVYTVLANLTGLPALSVPIGTNTDGIPLGIQIISKKHSECKLLSFSKCL